jgi:hypothetical protein
MRLLLQGPFPIGLIELLTHHLDVPLLSLALFDLIGFSDLLRYSS